MGSFLMQPSVPVPIATSGSRPWCCWCKQLVGAWPGRWKKIADPTKTTCFGKGVGEGNEKHVGFFDSDNRKKESGKYQDYIAITCKPWEDAMTNKSSNHPFEVLSLAQSRLMLSTSLQRAEILQLTNSNIKSVRAKSRGRQFHSKSFLKSWTKNLKRSTASVAATISACERAQCTSPPFQPNLFPPEKELRAKGFCCAEKSVLWQHLVFFLFLAVLATSQNWT